MALESMQGKTVLITGATSGIGEATALELAQMGASVIISGRNEGRALTTLDMIRRSLPPDSKAILDYLVADLSSIAEMKSLADEFRSRYDRLDVLVNNAGIYLMKPALSPDGLDMTFAVNHLSYFILTNRLLDLLLASGSPEDPARVVNVSSNAHLNARLDLDQLKDGKGWFGFRQYGRTKLMNLLFTFELARRMQGKPVTANAVHPGFVNSGFAKNNGSLVRLSMELMGKFSLTPEEGARTVVYLASSKEVRGASGGYYVKCRAKSASPAAYDLEAARKLWEVSEKYSVSPLP